MKNEFPQNIFSYLMEKGYAPLIQESLNPNGYSDYDSLEECPLDSPVGIISKKIIDSGNILIDLLIHSEEDNSSIRERILRELLVIWIG